MLNTAVNGNSGHRLEILFAWGDGELTGWYNYLTGVYNSNLTNPKMIQRIENDAFDAANKFEFRMYKQQFSSKDNQTFNIKQYKV